MAHRHTQRRNPSSMASTPAKHPKPTTTLSHHPDLTTTQTSKPSSFIVKQFSSLNLDPKSSLIPNKKSQTKHLQEKSMTTSAIFDSSKFSLLKPSSTHNKKLAPTPEKGNNKRISKEKPLKSFTELEKRKLHGSVNGEKKDSSSRVAEHDYDDVKRNSVSYLAQAGGGRGRSLHGSQQVDLGGVFAINGVKMISADMPPFMQIHAVDCARKAFDSMEKFTSKTLALSLKKEFDGVYGPAWHCIVGTSFGSFVTHSVGGFLYFSMDQKLYILLFKTAVQKVN